MPRRAIEIKWFGWLLVAVIALPAVVMTYNGINEAYWNAQYIRLGKAVDCRTRPSPEYLQYCNPASDGVACASESRSRLVDWHGPIDYACAQYEPERVFRFPVYNEPETLELAEQG